MGVFFLKFKGTAITRVPPLKEANGKGTEKVGREHARDVTGGVDGGIEDKAKRRARVRFSDKGRALEWLLAALLPFTLPPSTQKGLPPLARRAQETLRRTNRKCGRLALPERFAPRAHFLVISAVRLASDSRNSTELPPIRENGSSVFPTASNNFP